MKILIEEFPFEDFESIGLPKDKLLSLETQNLSALMQGAMTKVLPLEFNKNGNTFLLDAKLCLFKNQNKRVDIAIYPVRKKIDNSQFNFSDDELLKLYAGKIVGKNFEGEKNYFQLDRETFNVFRAKAADIKIPFDVDSDNRKRLLSGHFIPVQTENGTRMVKLDFFKENRFLFEGEKQNLRYHGAYFQDTDFDKANKNQFKLNQAEMQRLLDGYKTNIIEFEDGRKGKIGLTRNEYGEVSMQLYPVKDQLNNDIKLTLEQILKLELGELVSTQIDGKLYLVQLDRETNEFVRKQMAHVDISKIRGIEVSNAERDKLLNGQSIDLRNNQTGEFVRAKIDLNHNSGIYIQDDREWLKSIYTAANESDAKIKLSAFFPNKVDSDNFISRNLLNKNDLSETSRAAFDLKQRMDYDFFHVGYSGSLHTDRNHVELHEFILSQQTPVIQGIKV